MAATPGSGSDAAIVLSSVTYLTAAELEEVGEQIVGHHRPLRGARHGSVEAPGRRPAGRPHRHGPPDRADAGGQPTRRLASATWATLWTTSSPPCRPVGRSTIESGRASRASSRGPRLAPTVRRARRPRARDRFRSGRRPARHRAAAPPGSASGSSPAGTSTPASRRGRRRCGRPRGDRPCGALPRRSPRAVHVDVHPAGGHTHLDLRYRCPPRATSRPRAPPEESQDVAWFDWDEALALADPGLVGIPPACWPGTVAPNGGRARDGCGDTAPPYRRGVPGAGRRHRRRSVGRPHAVRRLGRARARQPRRGRGSLDGAAARWGARSPRSATASTATSSAPIPSDRPRTLPPRPSPPSATTSRPVGRCSCPTARSTWPSTSTSSPPTTWSMPGTWLRRPAATRSLDTEARRRGGPDWFAGREEMYRNAGDHRGTRRDGR